MTSETALDRVDRKNCEIEVVVALNCSETNEALIMIILSSKSKMKPFQKKKYESQCGKDEGKKRNSGIKIARIGSGKKKKCNRVLSLIYMKDLEPKITKDV